ncbi:hypothetical protein Hanom_Chr06g00554791 [Helianthus anomalus]
MFKPVHYRTKPPHTHIVDAYYVDATRFGSAWFGSTRLVLVRARRRDIPPSCAPEIDTRSTESRKPSFAATSA